MALGHRGSRRITVDGVTYSWRLRRRPTYSQALCWSPCTYAVEHAELHGSVLVVTTDQPHLSNWLGQEARPVVPADVVDAIKTALSRGWAPTAPGSPFFLDLAPGRAPAP